MNREQMKRGYDAMTPDGAARQRMLQRILEEGAGKTQKEYFAKPVKQDGWKSVAVAVLGLVLIFGVFVIASAYQEILTLRSE